MRTYPTAVICGKQGPCARRERNGSTTAECSACLYLKPLVYVVWERGEQRRKFHDIYEALEFARSVDGIVVQ